MAQYGTIVVVDDNPAILTALRICLDSTFEQVITLASPDSLPATLQQEKASIVLMDMNFTLGMNTGQKGLTWLRTLRHLHPQLPVVLITAYADVQLAVKCLKAGASDFVTKPWDNDELLRTLKDAVDKGQEIQSLDELERNHVKRVVDHCHGNISRAAELLGITRQTLYAKLHRPLAASSHSSGNGCRRHPSRCRLPSHCPSDCFWECRQCCSSSGSSGIGTTSRRLPPKPG